MKPRDYLPALFCCSSTCFSFFRTSQQTYGSYAPSPSPYGNLGPTNVSHTSTTMLVPTNAGGPVGTMIGGGMIGGGNGGIGVGSMVGQLQQHPHMSGPPPTLLGAGNTLMYQTNHHHHMQNGNYHNKKNKTPHTQVVLDRRKAKHRHPYLLCTSHFLRHGNASSTNWTGSFARFSSPEWIQCYNAFSDTVFIFVHDDFGHFCVCVCGCSFRITMLWLVGVNMCIHSYTNTPHTT